MATSGSRKAHAAIRAQIALLLCVGVSSRALSAVPQQGSGGGGPVGSTPEPNPFVSPTPLFTLKNGSTEVDILKGLAYGPGGGLNVQAGSYDGPPAIGSGDGNWPGINGMGFSIVSFTVEPCGAVAPHIHSNAAEWNTVVQGRGLVASYSVNGDQIFASEVQKGDSFVFPQGSVHFWVNTGTEQLVTIGGFSASLPLAHVVELSDQSFKYRFEPIDNMQEAGPAGLFPKLQPSFCKQ